MAVIKSRVNSADMISSMNLAKQNQGIPGQLAEITKTKTVKKYKEIPLLPKDVPTNTYYNTTLKTNLDLVCYVPDASNMQGLTYYDGHFYIGFDITGGNGKIVKITNGGKLVKDSGSLPIGHSAELAYRKTNNHIYIANGGGTNPTHIYEVDMNAATPTVISDLNFSYLGNSALLAIDNDNDLLIIHTAPDDTTNPTFSICKFDGTITKRFTIPNQGVPQGLEHYQGYLYFYTTNKITVLDLNGSIITTMLLPKSGESEGLTIAGDFESPYIAVGYNNSNRIYGLRTNDNKDFHSYSVLGSVNRRDASNVSLIPKIFTMAINTNYGVGDWRNVEWTNGFYFESMITSVVVSATDIKISLKVPFESIGGMFAEGNPALYSDGVRVAVDVSGALITLSFYNNTGTLINPTTITNLRTVKILVIGAMKVES
jgi:hypothetical protein